MKWEVLETPGNGDCFFHSIANALRREKGINVNHMSLRHTVAKTMLMPDRNALSAIATWMQMISAGLGSEVQHAVPIFPHFRKRGNILKSHLHLLYGNMLNSQLYWGDEYAIKVIERTFQCCILVYTPDMKRLTHVTCVIPQFYIPLFYDGNHYSLMKYNGKSVINHIPT